MTPLSRHATALLIALAVGGGAVVGCGGDDENEDQGPDPAAVAQEQASDPTTTDGEDDADAADSEEGLAEIDEVPIPDTEEQQDGFDAAVDRLPLNTGPLPIAQYITDTEQGIVVARIEPEDLLCDHGEEERIALVEALYDRPPPRLRRPGRRSGSRWRSSPTRSASTRSTRRPSGARSRCWTRAGPRHPADLADGRA